jgi:hypothetical protein
MNFNEIYQFFLVNNLKGASTKHINLKNLWLPGFSFSQEKLLLQELGYLNISN